MSQRFFLFNPFCLTIVATLSASPWCIAESEINFEIPARPLADALLQFSETSGIKVFFSSQLTDKLRSNAINGRYLPQQALQKLLAGTGVVAKSMADGTITLERGKAVVVPSESAALGKVTVTGKAGYEANDPYNPSYTRPNASTATKTDTPIMETPASIQIVPRSVLNDQQAIDVLEPLNRNVSGVLAATGGGAFFDNFIIRGFSTNGFGTLYRNGLLNRQNLYDPANVEQIEVLKGPAAMLYGRIEPGGIINLVTKKPLTTAYHSIQQQIGSYDLYRTSIDSTGPLDQDKTLLYRFNGAYLNEKSFRDFVGNERVFLAPVITWRPTQSFEANLEVEYNYNDVFNDRGIPAVGGRPAQLPISRNFGDNKDQRSKLESTLLAGDWSYRFNDDWKITNRFLWQDWQVNYNDILFTGLSADGRTLSRVLNYGVEGYHVEKGAFNLDVTGRFELLRTRHDVLVGIDYYKSPEQSQAYFGSIPSLTSIDIYNPVYGQVDQAAVKQLPVNSNFIRETEWYGLYFQDQITLFDDWHLLGGGRVDSAKTGTGFSPDSLKQANVNFKGVNQSNFSPRVGLLYQPQPWLSLYGSYTESFGADNGRSATGIPFAPQKGKQYEVGVKAQTVDQRFSATVALYDLSKTNLLTPDPVNPNFSILAGKAKSRGLEIDLKGQVLENLELIATYAYTDAHYTQDFSGLKGHFLENVARNQGSLWGTYQLTERIKFGLGGVAVGQRQGDRNNSYQLPGYVRMDAMLAYAQPIGKTRLTAQLNVTNLVDKDYFSSGGSRTTVFPGAPRTFLGSLKLEF